MYVGCISRWVESRGRDDDKRCEGGMNHERGAGVSRSVQTVYCYMKMELEPILVVVDHPWAELK